MTNWISREQPPSLGKKVLIWGTVPTIAGGSSGVFLGDGTFNGVGFSHDGTGHCGLVRVTHWAEIGHPEEANLGELRSAEKFRHFSGK